MKLSNKIVNSEVVVKDQMDDVARIVFCPILQKPSTVTYSATPPARRVFPGEASTTSTPLSR